MPQEDMQPVGLHFCNRVWRSLAKPRPDSPMQWRPAPEAVLFSYYLYPWIMNYHRFGWCFLRDWIRGCAASWLFLLCTVCTRNGSAFVGMMRFLVMSSPWLYSLSKCHFVFVRIFWRNRKWWAMHGCVLVNNIYIYVQTGSFFWITRPLLHQKQAVSDPETTLFFYWNNGFFVLIGTKNIAHIAFIRRNALCRRALRLHTKTARFCGRMILISEYFSMRTLARITL